MKLLECDVCFSYIDANILNIARNHSCSLIHNTVCCMAKSLVVAIFKLYHKEHHHIGGVQSDIFRWLVVLNQYSKTKRYLVLTHLKTEKSIKPCVEKRQFKETQEMFL